MQGKDRFVTPELELAKQFPHVKQIFRNISPAKLYEVALKYEEGSAISSQGALVV